MNGGITMKCTLRIFDDLELDVELDESKIKELTEKLATTGRFNDSKCLCGYEPVVYGESFYAYDLLSDMSICINTLDISEEIVSTCYNTANYYRSDKLATDNARADALIRKLRRFSNMNRKAYSNDFRIGKYFIVYNHDTNELDYMQGNSSYSYCGNIYFNDSNTAMDAINEFHDELVWYFTEYKDSEL